MVIEPVQLEGRVVRLEPLTRAHLEGLCAVGLDESIWRYMAAMIRSRADMHTYLEAALAGQVAGTLLPFVTVSQATNQPIGSTRYMAIDRDAHRLEIGGTWLTPAAQRTGANTEAKYLMLRHAFETLGCLRVELKTDALNSKSRAAILRIGARQEGIFRNHMISHDGRIRHSVYFSITNDEWGAVKALLEGFMSGG
ncbi:MAG: GNAT family N-acetyltransferase [Anaerolineales bacterium]|nr:GNAT family N-acetyltransferase [Anaerolineales bacterium]